MRRAWAITAAVLCSGCFHRHLERNAPGHVDVRTRPAASAGREPVEPEDPGERMVAVTLGPMIGGGLAFDRTGPRGSYAVSLEASAHYGDRETSHRDDDFFTYPRQALGLNLGWTPFTSRGPPAGYLEVQIMRDALGLGAGYAGAEGFTRHGAQVTGFLGPFYTRISYLHGLGVDAQVGLFLKAHHVWIWSR